MGKETKKRADFKNFMTLKSAFQNGDAGIVYTKRKSTGEEVALVCAFSQDPAANETTITPLAVMVEGNPYEDFESPE